MAYVPFFDLEKNLNSAEKMLSNSRLSETMAGMKEEKVTGKIPKNLDNFQPKTKLGKFGKEILSDPEVYKIMLRLRDA